MQRISKRFRIKKIQTTAFRPQSNGSLERSHHVLGKYMKQFVGHNEWHSWLELAIFSSDTCVHEGTEFTPYELVFRKPARLPTSEPLYKLDCLPTYDNYICNLVKRLMNIRESAKDNLIKAKVKSKEIYDKKLKPVAFKEGENVFLLKGSKPNKFGDHHDDPYKILKVFPNGNVSLKLGNKIKTVHLNRLKKTKIEILKSKPKRPIIGDKDPDFRI